MTKSEKNEVLEVNSVDDDHEFKSYLKLNPKGFKLNSCEYPDCEGRILSSETGNFVKWVKKNFPKINIEVQKTDKKLVLRHNEIWLPLVYLASDIAVPVYLNMVANYLYEKMRGALKGEKERVHFSVIYEDKLQKITKKIEFEGDVESLQTVINKFDVNGFLED